MLRCLLRSPALSTRASSSSASAVPASFRLTRTEVVPELNATSRMYRHGTGAEVMSVTTADPNKVGAESPGGSAAAPASSPPLATLLGFWHYLSDASL